MIPSYRSHFNANFTDEKYDRLRREMTARCGMEVPFALCETPCFFPDALVKRMAEDGKALIHQLVDNPEYRQRSEASIPANFRVPNEAPHPMFIQVDFGLVRDDAGELHPKLVELQAFPSLYAYQPVLSQAYIDVFGLDPKSQIFSERPRRTRPTKNCLGDAIVAGHDPAHVVLMEIHPEEQKTRPDFLLTEKLLGIRTVCITKIRKQGRRLFYEENGQQVPDRAHLQPHHRRRTRTQRRHAALRLPRRSRRRVGRPSQLVFPHQQVFDSLPQASRRSRAPGSSIR